MQKIRPWLPPIVAEGRIGIPAEAPGIVIPAAPLGSSQGVLEINADASELGADFVGGYYNCCDVYINAPASWLDLTMRIRSMNGGVESPLDMRAVADMQFALQPGGRISGQLFSIRGKPSSKFRVEAFKTANEHLDGLIYGVAWGGPNGVYGDRATRLPVDLYSAPGQQRTYTTANVPLVAGAPVTVFAANPTGDGIAITGITWTTDDGAARTLTLATQTSPIAPPVAVKEWTLGGVAGTTLVDVFPQPIYGGKGLLWSLVLSGGAPADHFVNVDGFDV